MKTEEVNKDESGREWVTKEGVSWAVRFA